MEEDNLYTIKKGDTFWNLEEEWGIPYGTLQDLNPNLDPKKLQIGQEIQIVMPTLVYLIAEEISYRQSFTNTKLFEKPRDKTYVYKKFDESSPFSKEFGSSENAIQEFGSSNANNSYLVKQSIYGLTVGRKVLSLENIRRTNLLKSNDLYHLQKNGIVTHPWKKMKNGASHWKNNIVKNHRTAFQTASKSKALVPSLLKKAGPVLLIADVGLSGEVKPSHVVNVVLLGASVTGVGAVFAGIYFVADIGTGLVTGRSISSRLDGWTEDNVGKLELYEGYY